MMKAKFICYADFAQFLSFTRNSPIEPASLTPKTEMLFDCTIGNRPSRFKIDETNAINIISESEHMKLLNFKVNWRTNGMVEELLVGHKEFKGIFVAQLKLANGNRAYANFFIRKGKEEFVMISKKLAKELKIS